MPTDSLTHQEYTSKKGERYEVKQPKDSDILYGDGTYRMETEKDRTYVPKKGERYKVQRPKESDIWQASSF